MKPLLTLAIGFIGQLIFIYGFLPVRIGSRKEAEDELLPSDINGIRLNSDSLYNPAIERLVLIVIDAFRDDFIIGSKAALHMPYLTSVIDNGEGIHFTSLVEPPTVTLPRIKALTMGTIPNYVDVIYNVLEKGSNGSREDSFIRRASSKNLTTIFYGDDTWLRLFQKYFRRSEGTSSFYVSDFSEVDENVTRHLDSELKQDDWDIMILHYLGLDHIGHVHGPYSKLVPPKLLEMDNAIQKLHLGLKKMGHSFILVICGDHGMKDTGGHGGATYSETHVPLIFVSSPLQSVKNYNRDAGDCPRIVNQRDLASTLSILLGLPPPSMNLGRAISCILSSFIPKTDAYLYALHVNAWQVASLLDVEHESSKDGYHLFKEAGELHSKWINLEKKRATFMNTSSNQGKSNTLVDSIAEKYSISISQMTSKLSESLVNFDYYTMFVGALISWQAFLISLSRQGTTSMGSCGMKIFLLFLTIMMLHMAICFSGFNFTSSSNLCRQDSVAMVSVIVLISIVSLNTHKILNGYNNFFSLSVVKKAWKMNRCSMHYLLMFGSFLHVISLFSSSYIEEEHQTWQFLCTSVIILLALTSSQAVQVRNTRNVSDKEGIKLGVSSASHSYYYHIIGDEKADFYSTISCPTVSFNWKQWLKFITVIFIHRLVRDWNHTGDKWGNLPDIGDWISEPQNIMVRSSVMAISLFVLVVFLIENSTMKYQQVNGIFTIVMAICMYAYRTSIGDVSGFNALTTSRGIVEFQLLLIVSALIFTSGCYEAYKVLTDGGIHERLNCEYPTREQRDGRRNKHAVVTAMVILTNELCKFWIILCTSLQRPGDVPIMVAFLLCCHILANSILKAESFDIYTLSKTFSWLGMVFYFFKGNSNSLASLDLQAGYTGQDNYNPIIVGLLLFCHTFSMPILAVLLLFHYLCTAALRAHCGDSGYLQKATNEVMNCIVITRLLPVVFYLPFIAMQRHHLFIWTVFAPKLLYEAFFTLASLFGLSLLSVLQICLHNLVKLLKM